MFAKETYVQRRAQLKKIWVRGCYCFWVTTSKA